MTQRFPVNRWGPTVNPVGEYVAMEYKGGRLLGEIIEVERAWDGRLVCEVRHFNGEEWPVRPVLAVLEWIKQD